MGKTVSAADMLSAGRRRSAREPGSIPQQHLDVQTPRHTDVQTLEELDAQTSEQPGPSVTRQLDDQTSGNPDAQTLEHLDAQTSERLEAVTTERLDVEASERSDVQTFRRIDAQASRRLDAATPSRLDGALTFQRSTVFFTPQQRQWIKRTTRDLPDGLSMSDVVRLAVGRLIADVTDGLDLVPALAAQAHADAQVFAGRRKRGLPPELGEQSA